MYKAIAATILGLALLVGPVFGETITPEQPNSAVTTTAPPKGEPPPLPTTAVADPVLSKALEQAIATKLEAMEMSWNTLDKAVWVASLVGIVVIVIFGAVSLLGIKSVNDINERVRSAARVAVDESFREKSGIAGDLVSEAEKIKDISKQLVEIKAQLKSYADLADTADAALKFDPLIEYRILKPEIERRHEASRKLRRGDTSIKAEDTLADVDFSRRVAVVFSRILQAAKDDEAAKRQRLSTVDLFNLSASASEADLDFVSLELMEIAVRQDKSRQPEVEARLIRQRLAASRITREEAKAALEPVLRRVNGFDLHLVVSEAFNIALHSADPAGMSDLIQSSLDEKLRRISYVPLVRAELLFMSDVADDWKKADTLFAEGLEALERESVEARWFQSSARQVVKLFAEQGRRTPPPPWVKDAMKFLGRLQGGSADN